MKGHKLLLDLCIIIKDYFIRYVCLHCGQVYCLSQWWRQAKDFIGRPNPVPGNQIIEHIGNILYQSQFFYLIICKSWSKTTWYDSCGVNAWLHFTCPCDNCQRAGLNDWVLVWTSYTFNGQVTSSPLSLSVYTCNHVICWSWLFTINVHKQCLHPLFVKFCYITRYVGWHSLFILREREREREWIMDGLHVTYCTSIPTVWIFFYIFKFY